MSSAAAAAELTAPLRIGHPRKRKRPVRPSTSTSTSTLHAVTAVPRAVPEETRLLTGMSMDQKQQRPPLSITAVRYVNRRCTAPVTHNVVATFTIDPGADVRLLPWVLGGKYTSSAASSTAYMMLKLRTGCLDDATTPPPQCVVLVATNGRCILTGTKSRAEAAYAAHLLVRHIERETGIVVACRSLTIQNQLVTVHLGYTIDDEWAVTEHRDWIIHRKQPRAIRIRMFRDPITRQHPLGTVLAFPSGVLVITGVRTTRDAEQIRTQLLPQLARYRLEEITKDELDERKRYDDRMTEQRRADAKLHAICEARKRELQTMRPLLYKKITTEAGVRKLRLCDAIYIGYCFDNAGKLKRMQKGHPVICEHYVAVRFFDDPDAVHHALNKMSWPLIELLHRINDMEPPRHCSASCQPHQHIHHGVLCQPPSGSPMSKKRPVPEYRPAAMQATRRAEWSAKGIRIREPEPWLRYLLAPPTPAVHEDEGEEDEEEEGEEDPRAVTAKRRKPTTAATPTATAAAAAATAAELDNVDHPLFAKRAEHDLRVAFDFPSTDT